MKIAEKLFTAVTGPLGRFIESRAYPNFFWELSWDITYVCNLRCTYCTEPRQREHPDIGPALEKIFRLRPKFMQVVGGEPLLVPGIAGHLAAIKERVNPTILLITNMMVQEDVVRSVVPYIDTLLVSIDALGGINREQRGVDGDLVLKRMVALSDWMKAQGLAKPVLSTSTVITRQSLEGLLDLGRRMREVLPEVCLGLGIVSPYWHPQSFGYDRGAMERLREILDQMTEEGLNYYFTDDDYPESKASLREKGTLPAEVDCRRQFFRANILPDGSLAACKPSYYARCFVPRMRECLSSGRYCETALLFWRAIDQFILKKSGTDCYFPCKCTLWMEELLNATSNEALPPSALHLAGRFSDEEVGEANRFLKKTYGSGMGRRLSDFLVRGDRR